MGDIWTTFGFIGIAIAFFYFIAIRPQAKRAKEQQSMVSTLQPGARIMTTAGVFGTVRHVGQQQLVVEISPGVEMTLVKAAISRVVSPEEDEFEYDDEGEDAVDAEFADEETYADDEPYADDEIHSDEETYAEETEAAERDSDEPADDPRFGDAPVADEPASDPDVPDHRKDQGTR